MWSNTPNDYRKPKAQRATPLPDGVSQVRESYAIHSNKPLEIDEKNHVIRGVKVLGTNARNKGRKYPQRVIEAAQHLYQNKPVNINHPKGRDVHRDFNERFGWLENVRMGDDGLYADLHYNPEHEKTKKVLYFARNNPRMLGLSPDHYIRESVDPKSGERTVTEIVHVHAVDLVADPSTTNGLKEALEMDPLADPVPDAARTNDPDGAGRSDLCPSNQEAHELEALRRSSDPAIKALLRQIDVLSVREAATRQELDRLRVRETAADQRAGAVKRCREAQLPDYAITDVFVDDLVNRDRTEQDKLIADRKGILSQCKHKPPMSLAREAVEKVTPNGEPADAPSVDAFIKEMRS